MVTGVVAVATAAHDAQRCGHGALARGQDRADQQQLGFLRSWAGEQRCEGKENGYNGIGQGEHGWAFLGKWGQASLPCLYSFSKLCVKPSPGNRDNSYPTRQRFVGTLTAGGMDPEEAEQ